MARKPKKSGESTETVSAITIPNDTKRAQFMIHVSRIRDAKNDLAELYQSAKEAGIVAKDINYAIKLQKAKEHDVVERRKRENEIAGWLNHPMISEPGLFDMPSPGDPIFEAGKISAMEGNPRKPPPHLGSNDAEQWMSGWNQGNAERNAALAGAMGVDDDDSDPPEDGPDEVTGEETADEMEDEPAI